MTSTREAGFIRALGDLVDRGDRAALAALRRGLGKPPGLVTEMDRHIVPWLRGDHPSPDDTVFYLVASLFAAWHQGRDAVQDFAGSLGKSLRIVADENPEHHAGIERRFMALLAAHQDELPMHLRHGVSLLRSHDTPVNWVRLLGDLLWWGHPDRIVQRRWARDFWHSERQESTTTPGILDEADQG
jgi:CRISPR system Cascade subunit CasB